MKRQIINQLSKPMIIPHRKLGQWKRYDYINNDNNNLCGIPISRKLKEKIHEYDEIWYRRNTIQDIVDDYNRRWKQNITVKDFKKNFSKFD